MIEGSYLTKIFENLIPVPSCCRNISFHIENSSFHRADLNNNDNIGFPFLGGYKEILGLDVTIFPCILLKELQYYIIIGVFLQAPVSGHKCKSTEKAFYKSDIIRILVIGMLRGGSVCLA